MFLSRVIRSNVRTAVRANSHWSNLAAAVPAAKQGEFKNLVAGIQKRKEVAQSITDTPDIDWDSYKDALGADVVDQLKAEYEATEYTDFTAEAAAAKSDLDAASTATTEDLAAQQATMGQYCADAEAQLDRVRSQYTTLNTTANAVFERYPELDAKYESELANHDYDVDDVPVLDVAAKRAALIEERWDPATMGGKLDEATQKEMLAEIAHMTEGAGEAGLSAETLPADVRARIDEFSEFVGDGKIDDATLNKYIALSSGALSADESAVTEEAKLFEMMEHYEALGLSAKAASVRDLHSSLEASGKLEVCEDWREAEKERAAAAPPAAPLGEFCPSELEGKTEEEIMAMADEAEANQEYYRGSQILLHHYRSTGEVDGSVDVGTFSGLVNFMDKMGKRVSAL